MFARRVITQGFGRGKAARSDADEVTDDLREISLNVSDGGRNLPVKAPVKGQTRRIVKQFFKKAPAKPIVCTKPTIRAKKDVLPKNLSAVLEDAEMLDECTEETLDSTYAGDAHVYLQSVESKCCPRTRFLDGGVTAANRRVLLGWMREVQDFLGLHQETFHMAVTIADLVVDSGTIKLHQYQLLGLVGFFIAAKYLERYVPQIDTLLYLASYAYDARTLIDKEKEVLRILDYDLNLPTPSWFLDYYARDEETANVQHLATMLLDLFTLDAGSVTEIPPSMRAASSLLVANQLSARARELWLTDLQSKSGYSLARLAPARRKLEELIRGLYTRGAPRSSLEDAIVKALPSTTVI